MSVILAIDQGTSSTKACVFTREGAKLGEHSVPVGVDARPGGIVTQDPDEILSSVERSAAGALAAAGVQPGELDGVALANQGESFLLVGPDGPLTPVISWQDGRGEAVVERLAAAGAERAVERTGLPLESEFPAPKLATLLAEDPALRAARFATLDTWMLHRLDPARPWVTDRATASRTMLVGLEGEDWDPDLLELFGVPREMLPAIVECDAVGTRCAIPDWPEPLPVLASGYDMGLALLGHGCVARGDTKATFGTCLGVMTALDAPGDAPPGLLPAIAYTRGGRRAPAADGEIAAAGALVSWAVRIGLAPSPAELLDAAFAVEDAGGVVLVPAINGLGAPHWRGDVAGRFDGLRMDTTREALARSVVEAIAWSLRDVVERLREGGTPVESVRVDGGLANDGRMLQLCADLCEARIGAAREPETTALGGALLGLSALGELDEATLSEANAVERWFEPSGRPLGRERERWLEALNGALAAVG